MKITMLSALMMGVFASQGVFANTVSYGKQDDHRIQEQQIQKQLDMTHQEPPISTPVPMPEPKLETGSLFLSADELHQYPDLVAQAMMMAVLQNRFDDVAFLLPYYEALPKANQETIVLEWARGMVAEKLGNTKKAVRHYRSALSKNSEASLLRLRLAMALFANKEYVASEDQFTKLLSEKDVPEPILRIIKDYLSAIKRQNQLSVSGGVSYLADKNINNAPKDPNLGGGWVAPKPQSAHGVGFNLGLDKKWGLIDGFFAQSGLDTGGKYYTDNKPYNELTVRVSAGVGHENAKYRLALLPFLEKNYYAGGNADNERLKYFSTVKGLSTEWSYWLTPKWQTSIYGEVAEQDYATRNHLDGLSRSLSTSVLYLSNARRYYFMGLDFNRTNAQDADDAFVRRGVRAGLGQELVGGFSARLTASVAQKDYRGVGFFGKIGHNDEYGASVSVWHKKMHYAGITPRLTWQYQKVDSNLPLYEYDKNKLFIQMSKTF